MPIIAGMNMHRIAIFRPVKGGIKLVEVTTVVAKDEKAACVMALGGFRGRNHLPTSVQLFAKSAS